MFEHVGINHYDTFFGKCASMLRPDGTMLLHTIGRTEPPGATNPFLRRYIFPGGYIPALSEVMRSIEKSGLIVTDIEILRLHYAETLKAWRENFMSRRDEAKGIYDEAFCRMWEFYLAGSEAAFRSGSVVVFQIQLAHQVASVPVTRDYIAPAEDRLARQERERGIPAAAPGRRTGPTGRPALNGPTAVEPAKCSVNAANARSALTRTRRVTPSPRRPCTFPESPLLRRCRPCRVCAGRSPCA